MTLNLGVASMGVSQHLARLRSLPYRTAVPVKVRYGW